MESLPKLFPTWNDVAFQDLINRKNYLRYKYIKPPDYGGIGSDVNFCHDGLHCENVKNYKRQVDFAAETCSLPFIPIKMKYTADPCIQPIIKEKENFKHFCVKLHSIRNQIKRACYMFPKIKALQQSVLEIRNSEKDFHENTLKIPMSLKCLVENIPKQVSIPKFNADYKGGNLSVIHSGSPCLLHPYSEDLNKLCLTPLQIGTASQFEPVLSDQKTILLKQEPILQIEASNNDCCVVRMKSNFYFLNVVQFKLNSKKAKSHLHHIALNPYNPVEVLSVYDLGKLKLVDMEIKKTKWSACAYESPDPSVICPTWECDFGSHPFATLCMNGKHLYLFDLRNNKRNELFCIRDSSFHVEEELTSMKLWNRNPFQHFLTSTDHFIVCDERYPKTPVMIWNHTLNDYPTYCAVADFHNNTKTAVIIGAQESRKIAAFFIDLSQTVSTPVSLGPPLELSSPSDCIDSLKLHAYPVSNKLSTQLAYPLTGISIEPHRHQNAFTVFQATSAGDVFYQDFRETFLDISERTYRVTTGCILTPPEKILPSMKDCLSSKDTLKEDVADKVTFSQIHLNISKILDLPKEISADCSLCRHNNVECRELVFTEVCPGCNLGTSQSFHLSKALTNLSTVIGPVSGESKSLDLDLYNLSQFTDSYSKKILNVWTSSVCDDQMATQESSSTEITYMDVDHVDVQANVYDSSYAFENISSQNENLAIQANSFPSIDAFFNDPIVDNQSFDFVPPSQEVRSRIGETIFSPVKPKLLLNRSRTLSKAGF